MPKVGILQSSTFRRLNPQGFNKQKPKANEKSLINTYKHPNHAKLEDEKENVENEYAPLSALSLADFVSLNTSPGISPWQQENAVSAADVLKLPPLPFSQSFAEDHKNNKLPNVRNASDFPSLPHKAEKIGDLFDDPEPANADRSPKAIEGNGDLKRWNEVAKKSIYMTPPPRRSLSVPPKQVKGAQNVAPMTKALVSFKIDLF